MGNLIDFGEAEKIIRKIEEIFVKFDLNIDERQLIVQQLNGRIQMELQKHKSRQVVENMPLGGLMKKFMKQQEDEDVSR